MGGVLVYGHTGVVGAQLFRWLAEHDTPMLGGISLDRENGYLGQPPEWVFVCVPTPTTDAGQDLSAVESVLARHAGHECAVVIRSTVLPGTCDRIQAEHPEWAVYHWPEFLNARSAWEDFCNPRVQVIGNGIHSSAWDSRWESVLPRPTASGQWVSVSLASAEGIKYGHNVHGAMQVIFANLMHDVCRRAGGGNWAAIAWGMTQIGYVTLQLHDAYWDVWRDNKRGYAGACFPKDVKALLAYMGDEGELLDGMERANARLLAVKR